MRHRHLTLSFLAAAVGPLLATSPVLAHIDLIDPPARAHGTAAAGDTSVDQNTNQKAGPCGQVANGRNAERVTTYAPGQTITVVVNEETNHDSYIRVAIDLDGDDDFQLREPVAPATSFPPETADVALAAEESLDSEQLLSVYRESNTMNGFLHEIEVTLPNETCDNCTLQVIQLMYNSPQIYYFQCADIVISEAGAGSGDAGVGEGGAGSPGSAGASGAGTGGRTSGTGGSSGGSGAMSAGRAGNSPSPTVAGDDEDDGGCAFSAPSSRRPSSAGLVIFAALALVLVKRRRH
jgi:hypothetical protein